MSAEPIDFGVISQGEYVVLTFTFKQGVTTPGTGTPTDPSGGAFVNMTPPGGAKTSYTSSLTHAGAGVYTLGFSSTTPPFGWWKGTAYAPAGSGQAAQPFQIEVEKDDSYGP